MSWVIRHGHLTMMREEEEDKLLTVLGGFTLKWEDKQIMCGWDMKGGVGSLRTHFYGIKCIEKKKKIFVIAFYLFILFSPSLRCGISRDAPNPESRIKITIKYAAAIF